MYVQMKNVLITVGAVCIFSSIHGQKRTASGADTVQLKKEVIIFGKGITSSYAERSSSIQNITMEQNKNLPIRSVNEALSYIPGLDFRQRGVQGVQGDLSIRGGTFEQNIVLVNGFKLVDPQTGHHALNLPVLLTNVETIEVYKGSGTRVFGQNAMTGAVNFVTRPKEITSVNGQIYGGYFGGLGSQFSVSMPLKNLKQTFSAAYDKSNGHWYNSDFSNQQYCYDAILSLGRNNEVRGLVGFTDRAFGANGYYSASFPDQWESTQMALAGLSHKFSNGKFVFLTKASLRTHRDEFRLKRMDPSFYTNKHWSEVVTFEETGQWKSVLGLTGFGAEYRMEQLASSNLGERSRDYLSGFLDHQVKLFNQKLILTANVHFFHLEMNGNRYQKLLPGFEATYLVNKSWRFFGNVSQSYRAPTYTELYYQDYSNLGNPNLQPEYATSAEMGFEWSHSWGNKDKQKNRLSFESAYYHRNNSNMIDWQRSATSIPNPWMPVNLSSVVFNGVESNVRWTMQGNQKIRIKELSLGYNFVDANHQFADVLGLLQSRYAFSGLRNQLVAKGTLILGNWATFSVTYRGCERFGSGTVSLLDAKFQFNASKSFNLFVEGNNLLNVDYVEAGYVQMPGIWGKAGVSFNFDQFDKRRGIVVFDGK